MLKWEGEIGRGEEKKTEKEKKQIEGKNGNKVFISKEMKRDWKEGGNRIKIDHVQ